MISSFTLWSSRTTSSRISCRAEPHSEGTDAAPLPGDVLQGSFPQPGPGQTLPSPPSVWMAARRLQGTQTLPFPPLAPGRQALTCFIRSKSKASRPTSFTLPAGFTLEEQGGGGRWSSGSTATHAGTAWGADSPGLCSRPPASQPFGVFSLRLPGKDVQVSPLKALHNPLTTFPSPSEDTGP